MSRVKYDFENLRERFTDMTEEDIMREYVGVLAEIEYIEEHMSVSDYLEYSEPLMDAEMYLSGYLARMVCYERGIEIPGII